jgi:hypothetical protein
MRPAWPTPFLVLSSRGDFLLIEAAHALPRWLRPDTATGRVWIAGGRVHIVPPEVGAGGAPLDPAAATAAVRDPATPTDAGARVHRALDRRLARARDAAGRMHAAKALLPRALAGALAADGQLVSLLVAAFARATPADLKRVAHGPGGFLGGEAAAPVATRVSLQRLTYAVAASTPYAPPRAWPCPPMGDPLFNAADLGAKLAAGAELVVASAPPSVSGRAPSPSSLTDADLDALPGWHAYLGALDARGVFAGETPGSHAWRRAHAAAADRYRASAAAAGAARDHPAARLLAAAAVPIDDAMLTLLAAAEDSSDDWLTGGSAAAAALADAEADAAAAGAPAPRRARPDPGFDPADVAARVKAFVDKVSSFEGATVAAGAGAGAQAPAAPAPSDASSRAPPPPSGLNINDGAFWEELGACLGVPVSELTGEGGGGVGDDGLPASSSSDEDASFYGDAPSPDSGSDAGDGGHGERAAAEAARLRAVAAATGISVRGAAPAGDADMDAEPTFGAVYEDALGRQLAGTTLGATFGAGGAAPAAAHAAPRLTPVDVDVNLVESLLASYAGEGGLQGPASTLAGLLGVSFPDDRE